MEVSLTVFHFADFAGRRVVRVGTTEHRQVRIVFVRKRRIDRDHFRRHIDLAATRTIGIVLGKIFRGESPVNAVMKPQVATLHALSIVDVALNGANHFGAGGAGGGDEGGGGVGGGANHSNEEPDDDSTHHAISPFLDGNLFGM